MSDTVIAIIGVIAGFITAFFAEPVKSYFRNKSQLNNLRIALYKELYYDYQHGIKIAKKRGLRSPPTRGNLKAYVEISNEDITSEFYKQTIQKELGMFYQLKESITLHSLYGSLEWLPRTSKKEWITRLADIKNVVDETSKVKAVEMAINVIAEQATDWCEIYKTAFYLGKLDKRVLKRIAKREDYLEIISNGKQAFENREAKLAHLTK